MKIRNKKYKVFNFNSASVAVGINAKNNELVVLQCIGNDGTYMY